MTFKTKAIGLLAGSALLLSVVSGATAEEATGSASVTLGANDAAVGCTATLSNGDFGNATWNAATNQYEFDDGGHGGEPFFGDATLTVNLTYDGTNPSDTSTCDAMIRGTDFVTDPPGGNTIPVGNMWCQCSGNNWVMSTADKSLFTGVDPAGANPEVGLILTLANVTSPPDSYTSTLTVTITDHEE